jgi:hypothetical protein
VSADVIKPRNVADKKGLKYFFCRLCPFSHQPPRQYLGPTCHLSTLDNNVSPVRACLINHMMGEVSWVPKRRRSWVSYYSVLSGCRLCIQICEPLTLISYARSVTKIHQVFSTFFRENVKLFTFAETYLHNSNTYRSFILQEHICSCEKFWGLCK